MKEKDLDTHGGCVCKKVTGKGGSLNMYLNKENAYELIGGLLRWIGENKKDNAPDLVCMCAFLNKETKKDPRKRWITITSKVNKELREKRKRSINYA